MTIQTVVSAKSLWFGDVRQLNPRGINLYRLIVPLAQQWFGFTPPTEFDEEKGVRFSGGEFSPSGHGGDTIGIDITIYNNGIMATSTTNTDDTDLFIDLVLARLAKEGVVTYRPEMFRKKQYASEIVTHFDKQLAIPAFDRVCQLLSRFAYSSTLHFATGGLVFDTDPTMPGRQAPFRFERRVGASLSENLYYSHGPLKTNDHIAVLEAIEEALPA
ncbi:MAG: hypothetical protein WD733_26420 [Bryobacterales bacterium]